MHRIKLILSWLLIALLVTAAAPATLAEPSASGCESAEDGLHDWEENSRKEPTCAEPGQIDWVCKNCGVHQTETIPVLAHTPVSIPSTAATCTEDGLTEGSKCAVCGAVLKEQEAIPATGHTVIITPGTPATCLEDGVSDGQVCADCGAVLKEQEPIPATGHTPEAVPGQPATCTEDGLTEGSRCAVCGLELTAQEVIPATGHTPVAVPSIAATCTEDGLTEGQVCSVCGEVLQAQEAIPATGHTPVAVPSIAATCTEDGLTEGQVCSVCGEVLQAQEAIPATGHTVIITPGIAPTCTENGVSEGQVCAVCGQVLKVQEILPAAHTWSDWTVLQAATCTEGGVESHVCTVCGAEETRVTDPAEHSYGDWITDTPASCTRRALQYRKCRRCGATQWRSAGDLLDHSWDEGVLDALPQGFTPGTMTFTCTVCGATKTEEVDPAERLFAALRTDPLPEAEGPEAGDDPSAEGYTPGELLLDAPLEDYAGCWKAQYAAADGAAVPADDPGMSSALYIEGTQAALVGGPFADTVLPLTYGEGRLSATLDGAVLTLQLQADGFLRLTVAADEPLVLYCRPCQVAGLSPDVSAE